MPTLITPFAKALYLCDHHVGHSNGKTDLCGLFNSIRPVAAYPYTKARFWVVGQECVDGLEIEWIGEFIVRQHRATAAL